MACVCVQCPWPMSRSVSGRVVRGRGARERERPRRGACCGRVGREGGDDQKLEARSKARRGGRAGFRDARAPNFPIVCVRRSAKEGCVMENPTPRGSNSKVNIAQAPSSSHIWQPHQHSKQVQIDRPGVLFSERATSPHPIRLRAMSDAACTSFSRYCGSYRHTGYCDNDSMASSRPLFVPIRSTHIHPDITPYSNIVSSHFCPQLHPNRLIRGQAFWVSQGRRINAAQRRAVDDLVTRSPQRPRFPAEPPARPRPSTPTYLFHRHLHALHVHRVRYVVDLQDLHSTLSRERYTPEQRCRASQRAIHGQGMRARSREDARSRCISLSA